MDDTTFREAMREAGRRGGLSGGRRRWWESLTAAERHERQAKAARARWAKFSPAERSEIALRRRKSEVQVNKTL